MPHAKKLTLYFDGLCAVCSREIAWYQRKDTRSEIEFKDITDPKFSAETEGLDPRAVQTYFHVRDATGRLFIGVDGFIEIWRVLPGFGSLAKAATLPPVHLALQLGYQVFVKVRPWLPRRKRAACETDRCDLVP